MRRLLVSGLVLFFAQASWAQLATTDGTGAMVRVLDKLTGQVSDVRIADGRSETVGRITVTVAECRYPDGNAAGEAYASLVITDRGIQGPVFEGWMIASSPALNAMDHQRYDVWVLRCTTS
jgi:hypothetical protein